MWAAGVVLVLSVAAWVAGSRWFVCVAGHHGGVQLDGGDVVAYSGGCLWSKGWHIASRVEAPPDRVFATFLPLPWEHPDHEVRTPIWTIGTCAGVGLLGAWYLGRRDRLWARAGQCGRCGYDLTGIDGPCPECGRAVTNPTSSP